MSEQTRFVTDHRSDGQTGLGDPTSDSELPAGASKLQRISGKIKAIGLSLVLTFAALSVVSFALGANPISVLSALASGAFGSPFTIGQTLTVAGILVLTGLAAALPFSARLWNVGGEGQLFAGAIAALVIGLSLGPTPLTLWLALMGGCVAGALWALIPGMLRAYLGASEMIISLLMNFVAIFAASYVINQLFPSTSGESTPPVDHGARLPVLVPGFGINLGLIIVASITIACWFLSTRTRLGFAIRATGLNSRASLLAGFDAASTTVATFSIAGACAGLAGAIVVLGSGGTLSLGISASYGYLGVAVALVAGVRVVRLPAVALMFAALTVGSNSLQVSAGLPFSLGVVITGAIVISLLATRAISLGGNAE